MVYLTMQRHQNKTKIHEFRTYHLLHGLKSFLEEMIKIGWAFQYIIVVDPLFLVLILLIVTVVLVICENQPEFHQNV